MKHRKTMIAAWAIVALFAAPMLRAADDIEEQSSKYFDLVKSGKEDAEAKKIGESILTGAAKNADALNEFAWKIMTDDGIAHRDLDLAMRVAKAAYDACDGKEAAIVDTYAHALFDTSKITEAIQFQKKAIELCNDDNLKEELQETLKRYQEKAAEKPAEKK